jgi:hypothetical protein
MSKMTLKALREAVAQMGTGHDDKQVVVWLPGSKIDLESTLFLYDGLIMIEGNVRAGSALDDVSERQPRS